MRWLTLVAAVVVCAGLNVYRTAYWKTHGVFTPLGFDTVRDPATGEVSHWARSYGRVEVLNQRWRPTRLTLRLRGPAEAHPDGTMVQVSADYAPLATFRVGPRWSTYTAVLTTPAARDGTLSLQLETRALPAGGHYGFGFEGVQATALLRPWPTAVAALTGAAAGLFAWVVLGGWRPLPATTAVPQPGQVATWRRSAGVGAALFLYFAAWSVVRPPLQTGDEPQHLMRTTSVLLQPWVGDPGRFVLEPRFLNPMAAWEPRATSKLPFAPNEQVTIAELRAIKRLAWPPLDQIPPLQPLEKAIASYPTLYYLSLFAVAEPLTSWLHLSPYDATYAYRLVSSAFAAALWALVLAALQQTAETAELAWPVLLVVACNPMLAYLSSGVTADAVSNPLSALAILSFWHVVMHGTHQRSTLWWLVAGALVKPAALQLMAALATAGIVLWLRDRHLRPMPALLVVARAGVIAMFGFYLWSTPRFLGPGPSYDPLQDFLVKRLVNVGGTWIEYWGRLGWLDYQGHAAWYAALLVVVALNLFCVWRRPRRPAHFALFASAAMTAFLLTTLAGEFIYLPQAGYTLQGRYFLPVALLFTAVTCWHHVRWARRALVTAVVILCALLVQRTVDRYYLEGWRGVKAGLPFVLATAAPGGMRHTT